MIIHCHASEHVVADLWIIQTSMEVGEVKAEISDGSTVAPRDRGEVLVGTGMMTVVINTVFFIPKLQLSLLSCSRLHENGITAVTSGSMRANGQKTEKLPQKYSTFQGGKLAAFTP